MNKEIIIKENEITRIYKPEELKIMNYIFGKEENNKYFTKLELQCASRIDLFDVKVVNICKIIWDNKDNTEKLERFMDQLDNSNKRKEDKYMNNKLMIFKNEEFGEIRSLEINNEPYFVGKDIAGILIYKEPHKAIVNHVDEDDRIKYPIIDELGRKQETWLINESGLYSLIMSSKLPKAKLFKRWVTSEVLPSIRKNGSYSLDTNGLMKQLVDSQSSLNYVLAGFKMQIDKDFKETNIKLNEHDELLKKRVYINPVEAKKIQEAVKEKAKQIAIDNNLQYHTVKSKLFARLYDKLKNKFNVATYRELPSIYFDDIMKVIKKLNIYTQDLKEEQYQMSM